MPSIFSAMLSSELAFEILVMGASLGFEKLSARKPLYSERIVSPGARIEPASQPPQGRLISNILLFGHPAICRSHRFSVIAHLD